jgi:phosphoglycolate phosphatase
MICVNPIAFRAWPSPGILRSHPFWVFCTHNHFAGGTESRRDDSGGRCRRRFQKRSSINRKTVHKVSQAYITAVCCYYVFTFYVLSQTHSTDEEMFSAASFSGLVEFSSSFSTRPQISHVVFDFDGTIAWLKHGWPDIMANVLLSYFPKSSDETLRNLRAEILTLNGKPPIFQIRRCLEMAHLSAKKLPEPEQLLKEYASKLGDATEQRVMKIRRRKVSPESFLVHGTISLLNQLRDRKLTLIILSGTEQERVQEEAELLGLKLYFGRHIYGSTTDLVASSKEAVIGRLLAEENISGEHLLSFGDGPVEIQVTKQVGGLAVGVASDENVNGSGKMDPQKQKLLKDAGADVLVPDYRDTSALVECLFAK